MPYHRPLAMVAADRMMGRPRAADVITNYYAPFYFF